MEGGCKVPRGVQGRAVALAQEAGRHVLAEVLEVYDQSPLGGLGDAGLDDALDGGVEVGLVEGFAAHEVEGDAQACVGALEFLHRELGEVRPGCADVTLLAALQLAERGPPGLGQLRIVLLLLVHADVQRGEGLHRVVLEVDRVAPAIDRCHELAELRAPVADVVDADGLVAEGVVEAAHGGADDGRAQVTDMEALGDVGRGVVEHDRLAPTLVRAAVALTPGLDVAQNHVGECLAVDREVEVRPGRNGADALDRELLDQLRGDLRRGLLHGLRQGEAREGQVPEAGVARGLDLERAPVEPGGGGEGVANLVDELLHGTGQGIRSGPLQPGQRARPAGHQA